MAFQVAAQCLRPPLETTPWLFKWLPNEGGYFNETFENYEALGELTIVEQLKQIASELQNPEFSGGGEAPDQGRRRRYPDPP